MSSFITRFIANMSVKDSKTTQPAEARPRRHERSRHHHHCSRRSSYISDSDSTETDDEPPSENSLMLDLGPDYSPKAMSSISFPSPPMSASAVLFDAESTDSQRIHVHRTTTTSTSSSRTAVSQTHRKPVQYYDSSAQAEANFRQPRGRSSSRSSTASQREARRTSQAYSAGSQWIW